MTFDKVWSKTDDRFGGSACLKVFKMGNTQLAAAVESADQSSSDQSSCHFFGKTHLMNTK